MVKIFTPSFADESDTNAQNLSVKEIVARLDPWRIAVTMMHQGAVDPRIAARPNTRVLQWQARGNTLRAIWEILRNVPDVYFFPREGPLDAAFLALRRTLGLNSAVVTYVVTGGLYSDSYSAERLRNIREADTVVGNNTYLSHLVKEKLGRDAGTIYDGIDRRYFFPPAVARAATDRVTVLYVGSLRPYKRVPLVVQEAARHPEVHFHIAGLGEEEQVCRDLAAKLKCDNVEFLGHLTPAQLGNEMRGADVFFFPSILEGHPQVLLQAAATGLPSVAMNIYRPDYIVSGATGFLVETDAELSEKLDLLVHQPNLRHSMGEAARVHAQKFDWDVIARKWQDVFEQAAERRH
jgi:glycosyltransferase involved in cell wall biosynthesis